MEILIRIVHILSALGVIGLVLMQHGKGADMGAAFGSGASGSLFGVSGSTNFLSRATAICVTIFFAASLALGYFSSHRVVHSSVMSLQKNVVTPVVPPSDSANMKTPVEKLVGSKTAKDVPQ
ncbi:MAG: preprotein translocase subunit SecG [Methylophilaceae bacterium]|nr:preprotein translocase subunit SecG [Methylophilaceae bacterium]